MIYRITLARSAKKALAKRARAGTIDQDTYRDILSHLERGIPMPPKYKDHKLQGDLSEFRECHISFNLLMTYKRNVMLGVVTIENIGTHEEVFGE